MQGREKDKKLSRTKEKEELESYIYIYISDGEINGLVYLPLIRRKERKVW